MKITVALTVLVLLTSMFATLTWTTATASVAGGSQTAENFASTAAPSLMWNRTYGAANNESARAVAKTSDGGYLIGGQISSPAISDFFVVKTDSEGNQQWNRTYNGGSYDSCNDLIQTSDGGYALAGESGTPNATSFSLFKIDSTGRQLWNRTYNSGTTFAGASALLQTGDGGYMLLGYAQNVTSDFWLVRTDSNGAVQWNHFYGGSRDDWGNGLVQTSDGGYALIGETYSTGSGTTDKALLFKVDSNGTQLWYQVFGGTKNDMGLSIVQASDGGFAIGGATASYGAGGFDAWLIKANSAGDAQWNATYGGAGDDVANSLLQTTDGGYALAGYTAPVNGTNDMLLVRTDVNGTQQWTQTYGGSGRESALGVVQAADGGYVLAGYTTSYGVVGSSDFLLVKFGSDPVPEFGFWALQLAVAVVAVGALASLALGKNRKIKAKQFS